MQTLSTGRGLESQIPLFRAPRSTAGVDVHAVSMPARGFTGDFYMTHRRGHRLWLAIGDVAGKGLPAAVVMAMIQEELEHRIVSCANSVCDPATTMTRLHTYLKPLLSQNRFATAAIGHLHDDGTLVLTNGGHCPPMIARRDGTVETIDSTGPVLGMLTSPAWTSVSLKLHRGDTLLLYTDGTTEAGHEEFGSDRLTQTLQAAASAPRPTARSIGNAVLEAVKKHSAPTDDLTIVVARP